MAASTQYANVLLSTFGGLGLPPTLCLPIDRSRSISDLISTIYSKLPPSSSSSRLILTTTSNHELSPTSSPISTLLSPTSHDLPLRLSLPLCGGKGGFGSQLRAAGGRMSSKRKKNNQDNNGSNRNLDGRRLRTVAEAKALAEYLAVKPEMDRKEKEARRQRWEQVIEAAEKREAEIKSGAKGKVDGQWVEDKEEAGERTREAVRAAMRSGDFRDSLHTKPAADAEGEASLAGKMASSSSSSGGEDESRNVVEKRMGPQTFFGFDEDDEDEMSSDEEVEDAVVKPA